MRKLVIVTGLLAGLAVRGPAQSKVYTDDSWYVPLDLPLIELSLLDLPLINLQVLELPGLGVKALVLTDMGLTALDLSDLEAHLLKAHLLGVKGLANKTGRKAADWMLVADADYNARLRRWERQYDAVFDVLTLEGFTVVPHPISALGIRRKEMMAAAAAGKNIEQELVAYYRQLSVAMRRKVSFEDRRKQREIKRKD